MLLMQDDLRAGMVRQDLERPTHSSEPQINPVLCLELLNVWVKLWTETRRCTSLSPWSVPTSIERGPAGLNTRSHENSFCMLSAASSFASEM